MQLQRYNFIRPVLIILVAYLAHNLTKTICLMLGATEELAGNIAFPVMMIAAIATFVRLNRRKNSN